LVEKPVFENYSVIQVEKPPVPPTPPGGGSADIHKVKIKRHKFKMLCSTGEI